jgi:hypothetical protein
MLVLICRLALNLKAIELNIILLLTSYGLGISTLILVSDNNYYNVK